MRELSQNVQAVQKRKYRTVQREKRRRSFFIHDYIRTKYPGIFNEANSMYQMFVEKYPSKPDFTKSYYFKKWQRKIDQTKTCLMIPHLPILASPTTLQQRATVQQPEEQATVQQPEEQATVQQPEEQATVQQPEEQGTVQQPEEQGTHDETTIQFNEEVIDSDVQDQTDQFVQMSLEEIDRAVDHIVASLQNDEELRDIFPECDLPEDVWEKELAIPDYVLEDELMW